MNTKNSFYKLDPEQVLNAVEMAGFNPTGEFTQLNSYENRVFDIRLESTEKSTESSKENSTNQKSARIIAKFYRPGRWSSQALQEEHNFLFEIESEGFPVSAPIVLPHKQSLIEVNGIFVSFFEKFYGRMPEEFIGDDLKQIGRRLALLHNIGARKSFSHRPILAEAPFTPWENLEFLDTWIAPEVKKRYLEAAETILVNAQEQLDPEEFIRIHGDCHRGNILQNSQKEFFFVDFDDCGIGPAVQDLWMLFSSENNKEEEQLILSGYEEIREFPTHQLEWIPLLRGLRILNYAAWIARRWTDPSFPNLFPEFKSYTYWAEEVESLERISWTLS